MQHSHLAGFFFLCDIALIPHPGSSVYCGSKAAVVGYTRAMGVSGDTLALACTIITSKQ